MPARKRVAATVRIQLEAGQASPGKVGQSLGAYGVNVVAFITAYNRASAAQRGMVVPAVVTVYDDRSFDLQLKTPAERVREADQSQPRVVVARNKVAATAGSPSTRCGTEPGSRRLPSR